MKTILVERHMTFDDLPAGAAVFLDANVLVYAAVPHPVCGAPVMVC